MLSHGNKLNRHSKAPPFIAKFQVLIKAKKAPVKALLVAVVVALPAATKITDPCVEQLYSKKNLIPLGGN